MHYQIKQTDGKVDYISADLYSISEGFVHFLRKKPGGTNHEMVASYSSSIILTVQECAVPPISEDNGFKEVSY